MEWIAPLIAGANLLVALYLAALLVRARKKEADFAALQTRLADDRAQSAREASLLRQEIAAQLAQYSASVTARIDGFSMRQQKQLSDMTLTTEQRLEAVRKTLEERVQALQQDNASRLEVMRQTVDEKLSGTLEKRLGESFSLVSARLEQVYKGLGEMQTLAAGVGDLKKVLSNVKTRGTWGEISLGSLLEQLLGPAQFESNVQVAPRRSERVEFAIRLPGGEDGKPVYLPIDSKFPQEDYLRLVTASEAGDPVATEEARRALEAITKSCARDIRTKYIVPPHTTDFAIMYLPTEGLYAEITRTPGLCELLQREYRVTVAGPATLGAFLNSLQMGFRTLAIQKRSSEVWKLLGAIKTEFSRFGDLLEKTQKKLDEASNSIGDARKRSQLIENRLRSVEEMPAGEAGAFLEEGSALLP